MFTAVAGSSDGEFLIIGGHTTSGDLISNNPDDAFKKRHALMQRLNLETNTSRWTKTFNHNVKDDLSFIAGLAIKSDNQEVAAVGRKGKADRNHEYLGGKIAFIFVVRTVDGSLKKNVAMIETGGAWIESSSSSVFFAQTGHVYATFQTYEEKDEYPKIAQLSHNLVDDEYSLDYYLVLQNALDENIKVGLSRALACDDKTPQSATNVYLGGSQFDGDTDEWAMAIYHYRPSAYSPASESLNLRGKMTIQPEGAAITVRPEAPMIDHMMYSD